MQGKSSAEPEIVIVGMDWGEGSESRHHIVKIGRRWISSTLRHCLKFNCADRRTPTGEGVDQLGQGVDRRVDGVDRDRFGDIATTLLTS